MTVTTRLNSAVARWMESINAGDFTTAMSRMADDAVMLSPDGSADIGHSAMARKIRELTQLPGFAVDHTPTTTHVSDDGEIGFVSGPSTITFTTPDGVQVTTEQTLITVWRASASGDWVCHIDIVSPPGI